jgi:hypothetical protein
MRVLPRPLLSLAFLCRIQTVVSRWHNTLQRLLQSLASSNCASDSPRAFSLTEQLSIQKLERESFQARESERERSKRGNRASLSCLSSSFQTNSPSISLASLPPLSAFIFLFIWLPTEWWLFVGIVDGCFSLSSLLVLPPGNSFSLSLACPSRFMLSGNSLSLSSLSCLSSFLQDLRLFFFSLSLVSLLLVLLTPTEWWQFARGIVDGSVDSLVFSSVG